MITIDEKYHYGDIVDYSVIEHGDIFYKRKEGVVIGMKFVQHPLIDNDNSEVLMYAIITKNAFRLLKESIKNNTIKPTCVIDWVEEKDIQMNEQEYKDKIKELEDELDVLNMRYISQVSMWQSLYEETKRCLDKKDKPNLYSENDLIKK